MPALSRRTARLLRTVQKETYATEDDHEALPSPDADVSHPPIDTSESDGAAPPTMKEKAPPKRTAKPRQAIPRPSNRSAAMVTKRVAQQATPPSSLPHSSRGSKRSTDESEDQGIFPGDNMARKRKKAAKSFVNIHLPKVKTTYGRSTAALPSGKENGTSNSVKFKQPPQPPRDILGQKDTVLFRNPLEYTSNTPTPNGVNEPEFIVPPGSSEATSNSDTAHSRDAPGSTAFVFPRGGMFRSQDSQRSLSPAQQISDAESGSSSSLSEPEEISPPPSLTEIDRVGLEPAAICPYCRESVDPELLLSFIKEHNGGRSHLRFKLGERFCKEHRQKSAVEEGRQRGYPDIRWDTLGRRMRRHDGHIRKVLTGDVPSLFREKLAERAKRGDTKTLLQTMNTTNSEIRELVPGYYGTRGTTVMMDHIVSTFSSQMRKLAGKDKLIASGGVLGYVQAVLIPELAVQLIMEDMNLDSTRAEQILQESAEIGDLVNEDGDERRLRQKATEIDLDADIPNVGSGGSSEDEEDGMSD